MNKPYIIMTRNSTYIVIATEENEAKIKFSQNYPSEKVIEINLHDSDIYEVFL